MSRRVLVCGSRDFDDEATLWGCLDALRSVEPFSVLIEGEAAGADTLARKWAEAKGIPVLAFPADWTGQGRAAGPIRNRRMLEEGKPDLVVAFTNKPISESRGTRNMVEQAKKAGVIVHLIEDGEIYLT